MNPALAAAALTSVDSHHRKPHCSGCDEQAMDAMPWAAGTLLLLYLLHWTRAVRSRRERTSTGLRPRAPAR